MTIIFRYLTREIIKFFFIVVIVVVFVYIAVDFFEKIDNFMEAKFSLFKIFFYFLVKTPYVVAQITPICILLSVLIAFGLMRKNNEIIALKSCGVSIYYLFRPALTVGIAGTIFLFFLSETIVPVTISKANQIWLSRKKNIVSLNKNNIWIRDNRLIAHIKYFNSKDQAISGITLHYFDSKFKLIKRVDAVKGIYKDKKWYFYEIMEQMKSKTDENFNISFYDKNVINVNFMPQDLERVVKKPEEMSILELNNYIAKTEEEGYDAVTHKVEFYAKIAFPFVCIIMCLIATGISFVKSISHSLPLNIVYGIGFSFLYWIFSSFCISLGYGEILHPIVAAWIANISFLCFGILILMYAE